MLWPFRRIGTSYGHLVSGFSLLTHAPSTAVTWWSLRWWCPVTWQRGVAGCAGWCSPGSGGVHMTKGERTPPTADRRHHRGGRSHRGGLPRRRRLSECEQDNGSNTVYGLPGELRHQSRPDRILENLTRVSGVQELTCSPGSQQAEDPQVRGARTAAHRRTPRPGIHPRSRTRPLSRGVRARRACASSSPQRTGVGRRGGRPFPPARRRPARN